MKKRTFYSELSYLFGIVTLTLGVVLMEKADFGVSMVVAPAYLLYRIVNAYTTLSWFTFGMAEYVFQFVVLIVLLLIVRRFKITYLLSFATAIIYGLILDAFMLAGAFLPTTLPMRFVYYVLGMFIGSIGVSLMFHTYLSPEVYELFVKLVSEKLNMRIPKFKTFYDCTSLLIALAMSLIAFHTLVGVNWGTIVCALINGWLIGRCSAFFEHFFEFKDAFKLRRFF